MRAVQRTIVGVGLALVTIAAMALLIVGPDSIDLDTSSQPASQTSATRAPLGGSPDLSTSTPEPPRPVAADEDGSVGTLPPAPDASLDAQLVSRDLVTPSESAGRSAGKKAPVDGRALGARNARAAKKGSAAHGPQGRPEHDFGANHPGWRWGEQDFPGPRSGDREDRDRDDCRRQHRDDHRDDHRGDRNDRRDDPRDNCDRRGWR